MLDLVKKGVINGYEKKIDKGKIIASFAMGSQELYDFIDHNPSVEKWQRLHIPMKYLLFVRIPR
ncbi:hypothetical protein HMPREF9073_00619 [Capnocytophaga sp. oral taxon 326 str. F0382]|nr:hypothetical protein HMPREF9073_00619 [Capnocytophaga sp. oral taxon 326 str. F0382]